MILMTNIIIRIIIIKLDGDDLDSDGPDGDDVDGDGDDLDGDGDMI